MPYMEFSSVYDSEKDAIEDARMVELSLKVKYVFEVEKIPKEERNLEINKAISIFFSKTYGDMHGGGTTVQTPQEAIKEMQRIIQNWEDFDSIVHRKGDKVTKENLYFKSDVPEITLGSLFNEKSLTEWFK